MKTDEIDPEISKELSELSENLIENTHRDSRITYRDAIHYYALSRLGVNTSLFENAASKDDFWDHEIIYDSPVYFYFLSKIGLEDNDKLKSHFSKLKREQTMNGRIFANYNYHVGPLLSLVELEPHSEKTDRAIEYFLKNWKSWHDEGEINKIILGGMALQEKNYYKYNGTIEKIAESLIEFQDSRGGFEDIVTTAKAIIFLQRLDKDYSEPIDDAKELIKSRNLGDSDSIYSKRQAWAVLALIEAGSGPKVSKAKLEWEEKLKEDRMETIKPELIFTKPFTDGGPKRELKSEMRGMIRDAETSLLIISPYIDVLYEEIIDLKKRNPDIDIKIITRSKGQQNKHKDRRKITKGAISNLKREIEGQIRYEDLNHSRLIIKDQSEVLVSSADLTRDQLYDEFNAGIKTGNNDVVEKARRFFDDIWSRAESF